MEKLKSPKSSTRQFISASALILIISAACFTAGPWLSYHATAMLLLLCVSVLAVKYDIYPVLSSAVLSALLLNFFFIPPLYTFHIATGEDLLMLLIYIIIAVINGIFTFRLKREERKSRERSERRNALRLYNTIFNSLSHELKTPITAVIAAADILEDTAQPATAKILVNEIQVAAQRLDSQLENLLAMSRLESGMLSLQKDWTDITDLLYRIGELYQTPTHEIIIQADPNLPLVKLDHGLVSKAIENIIRNAVAHTAAGTTVTVAADYNDGACIITVADNGQGLPPGSLWQVFDKFYRAEGAAAGGTGLGLSIAKGFTEAHGGEIRACNDNGAVFTITLPAESTYINKLKNE